MELGWSQMITEPEAGPIFKVLSHLVTAPVSLLPRLRQQASCGSGPQREPRYLCRTGSRRECSPGSGGHLHVMPVVTSSATCLLFSLRSMVTWPGSRLLHVPLATGQNGERVLGLGREMQDCFGHETCYFSVHVTQTQWLHYRVAQGIRRRGGSSWWRKECSQEVFHQSDDVAKGTEIIFLRWRCQLAEGSKEHWEREAWETGWDRGQDGARRGRQREEGRTSRWDGRFL